MDDRPKDQEAGGSAARSSLVERAAEKLMTAEGSPVSDRPAPESGRPARPAEPPELFLDAVQPPPAAEEAPEEIRVEQAPPADGPATPAEAASDGPPSAGAPTAGLRSDGAATLERVAPRPRRRSRVVKVETAGLEARNLITPATKRTRTVEEFRLIKRMVLSQRWSIKDAPGNTVLVTSALPAEGKTTTAINLAMSIAAEEDLRVLLVDADFVKPDALRQLGVSASRGLIDVLQDPQMDIADVMLRTDIEKLSLVPAGQLHDRCTELLASARMSELINDLAGRYHDRILIFDSPPILATSESVVLTSLMGQIVFVVQAGRTKRESVDSALELIGQRPHLGLVLNRTKGGFGNTDFGAYYGSYYGSGREQERADRAAE
jgi:protein-tyrosine kinase